MTPLLKKGAAVNWLKLKPYHRWSIPSQHAHRLFTPPLDLLKGSYPNHFKGRWLPVLYNLHLWLLFFSNHWCICIAHTHTGCLMSEQLLWARKHNTLCGLNTPVKLQTILSLAGHYLNILTFLCLSYSNATAYFTSSYAKSAAPFLHEMETGNAEERLISGILLHDCSESGWFCRGVIKHPVEGNNCASLSSLIDKKMTLAQWTLLAVQALATLHGRKIKQISWLCSHMYAGMDLT